MKYKVGDKVTQKTYREWADLLGTIVQVYPENNYYPYQVEFQHANAGNHNKVWMFGERELALASPDVVALLQAMETLKDMYRRSGLSVTIAPHVRTFVRSE